MSDDLRELGKQLPWDRPDAARRDAVRSSLLVAAAERDGGSRTRWGVVGGAFAAGALVAAAALLLVMRGSAPGVTEPARIEASSAADFERLITRTSEGTDEIVRVHGGKVKLVVGALAKGDRVRIATRDAEVEGRGGYEVAVVDDAIRSVTVTEGSAVIRVSGERAVFLAAGESWTATMMTAELVAPKSATATATTPVPMATSAVATAPPTSTTSVATATSAVATAIPRSTATPTSKTSIPRAAATAVPMATSAATTSIPRSTVTTSTSADTTAIPTPTPTTAPSIAPRAEPRPTGQTETEKRFEAGWQLLKTGKPAEAARELGAAADAGGDDPLATDARYFQAVALTRAGRKTEAEHALVAFLDHAPHALRRGRAAVMLARLIAERGDVASARAWFESALHDDDPAVAAAAKAGLQSTK